MYKYERIIQQLIASFSTLPPNAPIPSRAMLCSKYKISRATADRIMARLRSDGVIRTKVGSGSFISPEFYAKCQEAGRTVWNWGVILPNIMTNSFPGILRGIEDFAQQKGINTIICNTDYDVEREHQYINRLISSKVNGLIIVPSLYTHLNMKAYTQLLRQKIPYVFCNRGSDELPTVPLVSCNNFYGSYLGTKYLIQRGYKHIGFLSAIRFQTSIERLNGFCAAHMEADRPIDYKIVIPQTDSGDESNITDTIRAMLSSHNPPDAIFCHNDVIAQQVYVVAAQMRLRISDDIGVIGFDNNLPICLSLTPKLTSISYRDYEIGQHAADLLYNMEFENRNDCRNVYLLRPDLVIRKSCLGPATVPTKDD